MRGEVTITHIGNQGDGLGMFQDMQVSIPFTIAGEVVRAKIIKNKEHVQGKVIEIIKPSPQRITPPCPVFGMCGGCRLQHLNDDSYREWKLGFINHLLEKNNFPARASELFVTPPQSRRRVSFAAKNVNGQIHIGFHARDSHDIINTNYCAVLKPSLSALITPLRELLGKLLSSVQNLTIHATTLNNVTECVFVGQKWGTEQEKLLISWGASQNLGRLYSKTDENSENRVLLNQRDLSATFGEYSAPLPPHAFMQASDEAEAAMIAFIKPFFQKAKNCADLFCGTGFFALNIYNKNKSVLAVDADGEAIKALHSTSQNLRGFKTEKRNLFREPLKAIELKNIDALCLDPPRAGAKEQILEISRSRVPLIAYVSCNPATFIRDAKTLVSGGYHLKEIKVFDQFLWSHHVEIIGIFTR